MTDSIKRIKELSGYLSYMRLPIMAEKLIDLCEDPKSNERTTLDILEEMIIEEYTTRRQNTIKRNLNDAKLSQPNAHIEEIDYSPSRKLNKDVINQLKTCQFILQIF